eukprot:169199-Pyramimonas_sp.AAC.1
MRTLPLDPSVELLMGPRNAVLVAVTYADPASGAFGGAPYEAGHETLSWVALTHADPATGAF